MFNFLILLIFILVSVAFFTLFEVKGLGSFHLRLGPDKSFFLGSFQPFADFMKLFSKSSVFIVYYYYFLYFFSPCLGVFLSFLVWINYFSFSSFFSFSFGVLFFFFISSLSVFYLLFSGLFSGSIFSKLGSFRAAAQSISYEVSMIFMFMSFVFFFSSFSLLKIFNFGWGVYFFLLNFPLFFCWFFSCLAETGRSPFDFMEGESELVSGFNTEYFSEFFIFIFLSEYSFIVFLCFLTSYFMGMGFYFLSVFLLGGVFVWVRASFPRFRFDMMMDFCWSFLLFFVLFCVFFCYNFSV
uniref:NADH-ubiquinone oxidoreductase chain 1 n=1 Tax=Unionicola foili TaxID=350889 RepID=B3W620_9ACAR|nr:NADH dehydrogenase subunit 1 [Unionicola foili]ACF19648.1 NADH dehydrogenase subunit 1 [Unionicola foili]